MARNTGTKVVNKFSRGLITEATGLNFPEDGVVETENVIFDPQSIARRRRGFDYESDYQFNSIFGAATSNSINSYLWRNVAGNSDLNFVVAQIGRVLYFWQTGTSDALSNSKFAGSIDIIDFRAAGSPSLSAQEVQFSTGLNLLFVSHKYCDPFYIDFDTETETFTATKIDIRIRDFEGIEEGRDVDFRPGNLTNKHKYNLKNQGWHTPVTVNEDGALKEPINWFKLKSNEGRYPSNADIWWLMKDSNEWFNPNDKSSTKSFGNTPAPRGHYVLNAFFEDRSDVSNVNNLAVVSAGFDRPSAISFFAGRVWYAGAADRRISSSIYFSQITDDTTKLGDCYQQNDPTSEVTPDLLPTDGGVVKIPDIGSVFKLLPIQSSMIVFASNGVWAISGSEGIGFTANDYTVRKISSVGGISGSTFADVEGFAIWWNNDGIYTISTDNVGNFQVESISDTTIKEFFQDIPTSSKKYAKASYNSLKRTVQWLYRSTEENTLDNRYIYDAALNFDLISKGFYPFTISPGPRVIGLVSFEGTGTEVTTSNVINSATDAVIDSNLDNIIVNSRVVSAFSSVTKYLTISPDDDSLVTWSEEFDTRYLDWYTWEETGVDYNSYFVTGYSVDGQTINYVQSNYVFVFINQETSASCFMEGVFDWAANASSNRYSNSQQVYNSNRTHYGVRVRKLKVRGKGRSIQLRFASETGKPFSIIGWSMFESGNTVP